MTSAPHDGRGRAETFGRPGRVLAAAGMNNMLNTGLGRTDVRRRALVAIFAAMGLWLPPAAAGEARTIATAQLDCNSLPSGPARTDCYIALSRIGRQEFEIAAGAAVRSKDVARHHTVTGRQRNAKPRAAKQKW